MANIPANGWAHQVNFNQGGPCFGVCSELYIHGEPVLRAGQFWNETSEQYYNRLINYQVEGHTIPLPADGIWLKPKTLLK